MDLYTTCPTQSKLNDCNNSKSGCPRCPFVPTTQLPRQVCWHCTFVCNESCYQKKFVHIDTVWPIASHAVFDMPLLLHPDHEQQTRMLSWQAHYRRQQFGPLFVCSPCRCLRILPRFGFVVHRYLLYLSAVQTLAAAASSRLASRACLQGFCLPAGWSADLLCCGGADPCCCCFEQAGQSCLSAGFCLPAGLLCCGGAEGYNSTRCYGYQV